MLKLAVSFTNFGPYHLARLRALAHRLNNSGGALVAYETAGAEGIYPWKTARDREPFEWVTLFPDRVLEDVPRGACAAAMTRALDRDRPEALGVVGYARPESMAMLLWAMVRRAPTVLMSESQEIDHPRVWWKEAVKRRRVRRFSAGLVGGPRHRDYLVSLGMPRERIALGYDAVDGEAFAASARRCRDDPGGRVGLPAAPYFLAVSRFAPEKNVTGLVRAYARYREKATLANETSVWHLVLCGDGPAADQIADEIDRSGRSDSIHRPGFLQADGLARWYAHASAFVHPSLMEPWGLVVNEAATCGLPLLVSDRAGCVETFVPDGPETTGLRIDGRDVEGMAEALFWMTQVRESDRREYGDRAARIAAEWGPERFAQGTLEALAIATEVERRKVRPGRAAAH